MGPMITVDLLVKTWKSRFSDSLNLYLKVIIKSNLVFWAASGLTPFTEYKASCYGQPIHPKVFVRKTGKISSCRYSHFSTKGTQTTNPD